MASLKSEAVQTISIPTTMDKPKASNLLFRGTLWIILAMGLSFFAAYQLIGREDFNLPRVERTTFHEPGTSLLDSVSSALGWNKRSVKSKRDEPEDLDAWGDGETTQQWENGKTATPNWDKLFDEFFDEDEKDDKGTNDFSTTPGSTTTTTGRWPTETSTPEYTSKTSTTPSSSSPTVTSLSSSQTPGSSTFTSPYIGRTSTSTTQSFSASQNYSTSTRPAKGSSSSTPSSTVSPSGVTEEFDECYHNAYPLSNVCQLDERQV